ncbi:MAG: hypothetical protein M1819_000916 [Sarea resinae]|nr:MAG: hypothetical protein M1819_000916 [Sarea resinae]
MDQILSESIVETPDETTPTGPESGAIPIQQPTKLKGRKRILQSLQRMSSSPSLAKIGRPSSSYRSGGRGSISCVSLSSSGHSYGNSYSSQSSGGYSTAPTTPGDSPIFHLRPRIRVLENECGDGSTPTSVALPPEFRPSSKGQPSGIALEISEHGEDYFNKAMVAAKIPKRKKPFDFWAGLPEEIKMEILRYLQPKEIVRSSTVSKTWHKMCFDGQLWISLDTAEYYREIPGEALVKIITSAGPFIRDLNLRGCVQLREKWGVQGMSDACRNLVNFSVEGCRIDRTAIHYMFLRNPRLAHINVSGLAAITNSAMRIIAQSCPLLEHLNVSWCHNVDNRGLKKVVEACPNLRDLRAGEIRGFDDVDLMLQLYKRNSLERLILNFCDTLNDDTLKILVEGVDTEVDPLTDRALAPPRKLKHLDLTRCRGITDEGIKVLTGHVPHLEGLQLSKCHPLTDDSLKDLLPTVPHLTHLELEELEELTNSTLQTLARSPCIKRLEHLSISYCENLGDTGMLPVIKRGVRLQNLDMDNTRISDLVLIEAASTIRQRSRPSHSKVSRPTVGLRMVVYDCQNVTWTGIREVLSRNAEIKRPALPNNSPTPSPPPPSYPTEIIQLKCFYGWQMTVEEHTKRVLRGDLAAASRLERKWAEYMMANEEAGAVGAGGRRRRRRAREAAMMHADEEEAGGEAGFGGLGGSGRRRRARSGGCAVM